MKFIIMPIVRFTYVIICFAMMPLIVFCEGFLTLWHWDKKYLIDVYEEFTQRFLTQKKPVKIGEMYYVYKNAWDYLRQKKTFKVKTVA